MVRPSCPALVIHDNDAFRKALIASLDQHHFTVTFVPDGPGAIELVRDRAFRVILLGLNLTTGIGTKSLDALREAKQEGSCGVIILAEPDPEIRTRAPWADETLLKPVDAAYVARRAHSYCDHG
jgi:DNA-binding response OmpR family regulator